MVLAFAQIGARLAGGRNIVAISPATAQRLIQSHAERSPQSCAAGTDNHHVKAVVYDLVRFCVAGRV